MTRVLLAFLLASAAGVAASDLRVWTLRSGEVAPARERDDRFPVGSLQKPWVVRAWAEAHPDPSSPPPRVTCRSGGGCWLRSGHGELGLLLATARSCNSWFLALARDVPPDLLARSLRGAGFSVRVPLDPWEAIGSGSRGRAVVASPESLLGAYRELITTPWPFRDELRRELLSGMAMAAREGTGADLGATGLIVKTGTVDAVDGAVSRTSGWVMAADPSAERLFLALLPRGTGSEAAAALGAALGLDDLRPAARDAVGGPLAGSPRRRLPPLTVRVRLLASLRPSRVTATNRAADPARSGGLRGERWVGTGSAVVLSPGTRLAGSTWELTVEPYGLVRVVEGSLEAGAGPGDTVTLSLTTPLRSYVEGVLRGELRPASEARAEELGAAVLRFLARGERHGREDVCDLVHCARFAGLGPDVSWPTPVRARVDGGEGPAAMLDDVAWERVRSAAEEAGPWLWSTDCGGEPLSERAVWGRGEASAIPCPRHPAPRAASVWSRRLPDAALGRAFGSDVTSLSAVQREGVRLTRVVTKERARDLSFDSLRRRLAPLLGWDALPSLPDAFERTAGGWLARGRGRGHRVGLCLSGSSGAAAPVAAAPEEPRHGQVANESPTVQ